MRISLIIICILINLNSFSQEYDPYTYQDIEPKKVLSDKVFFGTGLGLQFGTYTNIDFSPEFGIRITPSIELGIGGFYMYSYNSIWNYSDHVYGGKFFSRVFVYNDVFIQGEYEMLNVANFNHSGLTGNRVYIPGALAGVGFRQKVGRRSAILAMVMYNFIIEDRTPYYNPVFRLSFIY